MAEIRQFKKLRGDEISRDTTQKTAQPYYDYSSEHIVLSMFINKFPQELSVIADGFGELHRHHIILLLSNIINGVQYFINFGKCHPPEELGWGYMQLIFQ